MLVTPVRSVAVGDLRVRRDDARNAGHERYAEHAGGEHAVDHSAGSPVAGNAVNINNFAFTPATLTVPVGNGHLDQPRRGATHRRRQRRVVPLTRNGHQRNVQLHFQQAGSYDYICRSTRSCTRTVVVTP